MSTPCQSKKAFQTISFIIYFWKSSLAALGLVENNGEWGKDKRSRLKEFRSLSRGIRQVFQVDSRWEHNSGTSREEWKRIYMNSDVIAFSASNIVAAMLVSPLMGPVMSITFGTIISDWELVVRYSNIRFAVFCSRIFLFPSFVCLLLVVSGLTMVLF